MALTAGTNLGRYRVVSRIGAGGMGEVYLAEDTQLDRRVALKVLPAEVAQDPDRMRRFVQEAKAASALNHPNICVIHEIGEADGVRFLVMEYVEGVPLSDKVGGRPMATGEILDLGIQIADALEEAHAKGITHRDIKPANILITPKGQVKVLDFGLAKMGAPRGQTASEVATQAMTEPGMVMGTTRYMSPEQALGKDVDQRSDLFSLGVALYEMATGKQPFTGPTTAVLFDELLHKTPEPAASVNPAVPPKLEEIISKALEKDRDVRYQTAADLRADLKRLKRDLETGKTAATSVAAAVAAPAATRPRAKRWIWPVASVGLAVAVGGAVWFLRPGPRPPAAAPSTVPVTTYAGLEVDPAFSPDGRQIAFAWNGEKEDNLDIYVKRVDSGAPLRLTTDPASDRDPVWSPDGAYLAFVRESGKEGGIYLVPSLGGPERRLTDVAPPNAAFRFTKRLAWSPDGKWLAVADGSATSSMFLVSMETGERKKLTSPESGPGDSQPAFSVDGRKLAFSRVLADVSRELYTVPVSGGEAARLTFDGRFAMNPVWTPDGESILFASNRSGAFLIWKVAASGGTPERASAVSANTASFSLSPRGDRLAYTDSFSDTNIWKVEVGESKRAAGRPVELIASTRADTTPQFSPDGKRIAFASGRSGAGEIWVCNANGSNAVQLTSYRGLTVGSPWWSPDGKRIAYDARPAGSAEIFVMNADGGPARQLTHEPSEDIVPSWSRDGRWIYFASDRSGSMQIWRMTPDGGAPAPITKTGAFVSQESPDGKYLYYAKGRSVPGVWRIPTSGGPEEPVLEQVQAGFERLWAVVSDGIYFMHPGEPHHPVISFFDFATRQARPVATLEKDTIGGPGGLAVSPDERTILYPQVDQQGSDILMVENFRWK
ncbi:MAG TPA: protein kinase [Bryobacterales bacterium]|nr:protein kinase [Bryobacterales bacterium]